MISSNDRRTVRISAEYMATDTNPSDSPWEGRAWVSNERVCNVRCGTREIALDEALAALMSAGVEFYDFSQ